MKQWPLSQPSAPGPAERDAVVRYTGSDYREINAYLRQGGDLQKPAGNLEWARQQAEQLQHALLKAPAPPPPELVWRGVSNWPADFTDGSIVPFRGFQSTTIDPKVAINFSSRIVLEIKPKRGAFVQPLSQHRTEKEFLIPHGERFRIIGKRRIKVEEYGNIREMDVIQLEALGG